MKETLAVATILIVVLSTFSVLTPKVKAYDQLESSAPPAGYAPKVPDELNGSATALLIEDVLPWDFDSDALALSYLGISYDLKHSADLPSVNLAEYKFVILASDQPTSTYVNIANDIAEIDSYVSNGGVYIAHACDEGWSGGDWSGLEIMPGGVTHVTGYYTMYVHIADPQSPIMDGLDDNYFMGWGYSAHGYFTNVPEGADKVMVTETSLGSKVPDPNKPTYIIYSHGSGKVLATTQTIEWGWSGVYNWVKGYRKEFLPNEIKYAYPLFAKKGYIILVSGNYAEDKKALIDQSTDQVYEDMVLIGYSTSRIYYLNKDTNWRVNAIASSANLQSAIASWAAARVGPFDPLFLIMFDHGGTDSFSVNNPASPGDDVSASNLNGWLNTLETKTGTSTYVIYVACESGSFIDNLSKSGRVIITSSRANENSQPSVAPYWEYFQSYFWPRIMMGDSLLSAFNPSAQSVVTTAGYHPLLDDNGDGAGHGWDTPSSSGLLPHDGDGSLAANVYLTSSVWVYPQIDSVVATQFYTWPPPAAVNLWAQVENDTPLLDVTAWMLPPDWSPPPPLNVLAQAPLEPFPMTELGDSGNWTVNIPADAFTAHATGPSNFRFMITAQETSSSAIPLWTAVQFTSTGLPPPDTTPPQVDILRPKDMQHVNGALIINGTATDDVSLQRVELYANSSLIETVNVPPESSFFFQFAYTSPDPLSPTEFTVKAFDTSGNVGTQRVRVNTICDVAITDLTPYETEVGQGRSLPINVTAANQGQLTEAFKVIIYANETFIQARTVTLTSGASTKLTFEWNTTGFAEGSYLIRAVASFLPYEINVADNEIDSIVQVVQPVHAVKVEINPMTMATKPGQMATYFVNVTNMGNVPDTYNLAVAFTDFNNLYKAYPTIIQASWTLLAKTSLTLDAGQWGTSGFTITVPTNWAGMKDATYSFNVTATCQADPTVNATASASLTVKAAKQSMSQYVKLEIQWLQNTVIGLNIRVDVKAGLLDKLTSATMKVDQAIQWIKLANLTQADNMLGAAQSILQAFIYQVQAQTGKAIPKILAQTLIQRAQTIQQDIEKAKSTALDC